MTDPGPCETQTKDMIIRLDRRIVELIAKRSDWGLRRHVDTVAFEARDPDRHGRVRVGVGLLVDGGIHAGAERIRLDLEPAEWLRFQAFVAAVKREQAAGPEPW